jgi:hypothetical protein
MWKFGAEMGDEASGGLRNRKWGRSGVYRARSKGQYGGGGTNVVGQGGGLEKRGARRFFQSHRQYDNEERAWTNFGTCGRHG